MRTTFVSFLTTLLIALAMVGAVAARDSGVKIGDGVTRTLLPGRPAVGCTDSPHMSLRVAFVIASPRAKPLADGIRDEVESIWHRHGVALQWVDVASLRGDDDVLRLVVQDKELASDGVEPQYIVGWIRFVAGRPENIIRASRRTALAYVARFMHRETSVPMEGLLQMPTVRDVFARLLAWSLAHEIGHYLLAMPRHTNAGLMRRGFPIEDLIDEPEAAVALTPVETARLKALTATCRRADARTPR